MERRVTFALAQEAPARARGLIGEELASLSAPVREDAILLVSELITNAVRHAPERQPAEVELRVRTEPGKVRVVVADPGTGFVPAPRLSTAADGSGWGLYLVDRIADRWGVLSDERTEVWFEIDVDPALGGSGSKPRRRG
jgi:anti-sigma regulatory factor (Ser/Thr protein kinase)